WPPHDATKAVANGIVPSTARALRHFLRIGIRIEIGAAKVPPAGDTLGGGSPRPCQLARQAQSTGSAVRKVIMGPARMVDGVAPARSHPALEQEQLCP